MKTFLAVLAVAVVANSSFGVAQSGPGHWQYAYMTAGMAGGAVTIVYAGSDGCRYETPSAESVTGGDVRQMDRARLNSVGQAVQKLGADGWEMVGDGFPYCAQNQPHEFTLHFKRWVR